LFTCPPTTVIYTLSLHDALPIFYGQPVSVLFWSAALLMLVGVYLHVTEQHVHMHTHEPLRHTHAHVHDAHHQHEHPQGWDGAEPDRKSTRLNSSHSQTSYAVFCL